MQAGMAKLRHAAELDLPERLSVFGATRLAPDHLLVISALAAHRDVHLWLAHPPRSLGEREGGGRAQRTQLNVCVATRG